MKFKLAFSDRFNKKFKKLTKTNPSIRSKITEKLEILRTNPKDISLRSHKVDSRHFENVFSSTVTGDIRIIWRYDKNENIEIISLLDLGGHDGGSGVYK